MADNFFDTSALGKHYHHEVDTPTVDQLLADQGARHFVSRLTVVEFSRYSPRRCERVSSPFPSFNSFAADFAQMSDGGSSR
jgi:hypothetical protein